MSQNFTSPTLHDYTVRHLKSEYHIFTCFARISSRRSTSIKSTSSSRSSGSSSNNRCCSGGSSSPEALL